MRFAYLLVSHGSSDPRHQAGLTRLATLTRQHLDRLQRDSLQSAATVLTERSLGYGWRDWGGVSPTADMLAMRAFGGTLRLNSAPPIPLVGTATLEASEFSLAEQIEQFAQQAMAQGIRQIAIVPMFLLAGKHVKEDLPQEIAIAQRSLSPRVRLLCTPFLGSHPSFKHFVAARLKSLTADRCLLLAHGSRRPAGNRSVEQLAAILDVSVAFWSVPPDLETQVVNLMQAGHQHIVITPYFLFPGGITDTITRQTEALAERLPRLSLRLLPPLGTSAELAKTVAAVALSVPHTVTPPTQTAEQWQIAGNGITA